MIWLDLRKAYTQVLLSKIPKSAKILNLYVYFLMVMDILRYLDYLTLRVKVCKITMKFII